MRLKNIASVSTELTSFGWWQVKTVTTQIVSIKFKKKKNSNCIHIELISIS